MERIAARRDMPGIDSVEIDVDSVASLAMLALDEREKRELVRDLAGMVALADQLAQVDTEGVPPTARVVPLKNVFHEDIPAPPFDREALLMNAPAQKDGYVLLPQVVGQGDGAWPIG